MALFFSQVFPPPCPGFYPLLAQEATPIITIPPSISLSEDFQGPSNLETIPRPVPLSLLAPTCLRFWELFLPPSFPPLVSFCQVLSKYQRATKYSKAYTARLLPFHHLPHSSFAQFPPLFVNNAVQLNSHPQRLSLPGPCTFLLRSRPRRVPLGDVIYTCYPVHQQTATTPAYIRQAPTHPPPAKHWRETGIWRVKTTIFRPSLSSLPPFDAIRPGLASRHRPIPPVYGISLPETTSHPQQTCNLLQFIMSVYLL